MKERISGEDLVRIILENIHESLKWMWQIVMALALVKAVTMFSSTLNLESIHTPFDLVRVFFHIHSLVFLSFILTFVRFYFGDSRHLDLGYKETQFRHGLENELQKYSGWYRFSDIMLLITHGVFFFFLSLSIDNPRHYLYFFILLMFTNVLWLLSQFAYSYFSGLDKEELLIGGMNRYSSLLIWSINNIIFIIIVAACVFYDSNYGLLCGLIATIMNSVIDYLTTWKYYFPNLSKIYRNVEDESN